MKKIRHWREPVKAIDRPPSVPFMVQLPMSGKTDRVFKKGGIIAGQDGEQLKIVSIHSVEFVGKTIKIVGKAFAFEEVKKQLGGGRHGEIGG